ncbi:hypothetical protein R5H30_10700 [Sulfitobacter sp. D35]|uniref:hypothetical protein n=1 Tax=Sulfitobacter sp. D35 TaxID=3083252 RepID=UPI00296E7221|nr:hypothetical protein [Sulfitobacter sp. D35]MDW4498451.1 hypothetical protein [Sulfitobacter sp. D35]
MLLISIGMFVGLAMIASLTLRPSVAGSLFALATNLFFIVFSAGLGMTAVALLHAILLAVNFHRLHRARRARSSEHAADLILRDRVREIRAASRFRAVG